MNSKPSGLIRFISLAAFSVICSIAYSAGIGISFGQKMPNSLKLDTNTDDKQFCGTTDATEFCALYQKYKHGADVATLNDAPPGGKKGGEKRNDRSRQGSG